MPTIPKFITTDLVEAIKNTAVELTTEAPATHKLCRYADLRIEVTEEKHAGAENGTSKYASEDSQFACGIRVLAGDGAIAPGYFGQMLGKADLPQLAKTLASGLKPALAPNTRISVKPCPTLAWLRSRCTATRSRPNTPLTPGRSALTTWSTTSPKSRAPSGTWTSSSNTTPSAP